jgi:hypothetical protein
MAALAALAAPGLARAQEGDADLAKKLNNPSGQGADWGPEVRGHPAVPEIG